MRKGILIAENYLDVIIQHNSRRVVFSNDCPTGCIDVSCRESEASQHGTKGTPRNPRKPSVRHRGGVYQTIHTGKLFTTTIQIDHDEGMSDEMEGRVNAIQA